MRALLLLLICALSAGAQQKTAVLCGQLIDGIDNNHQEDKVIFIEGEYIQRIGSRSEITDQHVTIDLTGYTVMPGLIDAHVHPLISTDDYQTDHLKTSSAAKALHGLKVVQEWLNEGWTTIRIAGDADVHYAHFEMRDAINSGLFQGPRIFGAGHYLSVTGGGGDINYISHEQPLIADGLIVDGREEMLRAVRKEIKYGSDWIKLLVTGAFMSAGDNPQNVHFSDEEIRTAVEEAGRRGIPVMAHAHATHGINQAIRLGARSIEHGTFLTEESIQLFLKHDTYLIPTLTVGEYSLEQHSQSEAQAKGYELTKKYRESYLKMYARAIEEGVKIGVGSDNVGFPPGYAANEFKHLVSLGMTPMEAIQAGTRVNAELLMKGDVLGTISNGKYADIVATKGNPLDDISELTRVKFVMKGGEVIKHEK